MRRARSLLSAIIAALALLGTIPGGVGASEARAQTGDSRPQTADWRPESDDQWLFELRTQRFRIGDGVRGYANGTRTCVNLTDMIIALDLPLRVDTQLRRATGWAFDERRTVLIDRDAGRVTIASRSEILPAGAIVDTPEGWCVDPVRFGEWIGVRLSADIGNSVLKLESDQSLPFELAAARRARAATIRPSSSFNLADLPQARRPYAVWQTPSVDVVASAAVISDAQTGRTETQARYELFASGELLGASFDARLSSDNGGQPQSLRIRAYRSDPEGNLFGPLHATHAAIGDVSSLSTPIAAQPVAGRGAIITNRPLDLPESFDRTTFRGNLPAGWDAELYRNGQLLGFANPGPDGRYEFVDVRLLYGINRFEIVLYGPQGQVRREVQTIPVGLDAIPPRKTYYWAGIVQDGHDLIGLVPDNRPFPPGWRGTIGIERGLNRRTSIGAWYTSALIEDRRYHFIEGSVRRALGSTLAEFTGSWQSGGGTAQRLYWVGELGRGSFQVESLFAQGGYRSDRITRGVTGLHSLSFEQPLRLGGTTFPVQIVARYRQFNNAPDRLETSSRLSANWRNLSLTGQLDWQHETRTSQTASGPGPDSVVANLLANARLGRWRVRGEARIGLIGPGAGSQFAVVAERAQSERTQLRGELGYDSTARRFRVGAGYTRQFDHFALSGYAEAASDGSVAAGISLAFGFGPDPRNGRLRFSRERLASQGEALATIFYDDNGDGIRQPGEELAKDVQLTAGNAVADTATDANGQAIIDSLSPDRPILIGIDESSLPSPLVRPALPGVVIIPRAGVATRVMLPLTQAGEVEGVLIRSGGNGIEGVDLELVDAHNVVRATARTDFDGFFLFESVPYGQYLVRVSALSAQAIGIEQDLSAAVLDRGHPRVRLGSLAVNARSQIARAPPNGPPIATAARR